MSADSELIPPTLVLEAADGARAVVSEHGAHLLSWIPQCGGERLYLSGRSSAADGQAIRGGVPVIFPQFAGEGPLPKHGFARTRRWQPVAVGPCADGGARAGLRLCDDAGTQALWPYAFEAALDVSVRGDRLETALQVRNTGTRAFTFTAALHTYLRVGDIARARIVGLHGLRYRDTARGGTLSIESSEVLSIDGEIDRIYFDAPSEVTMRDDDRQLRITQSGFSDTVVWNPGEDKAAALHDLDPGGWRQMLCIEAATIRTPVQLNPGASWRAAQILEAA